MTVYGLYTTLSLIMTKEKNNNPKTITKATIDKQTLKSKRTTIYSYLKNCLQPVDFLG